MSDVQGDAGFVTNEEAEVARDEAAMPETAEEAPEPEPAKTEYIEFVGDTGPTGYGTQFHTAHGVSRKVLKDYHDIVTPKDLEWTKGKNGRFLVPVADMSTEAAEFLAADPMFRRVTL